MADFCRQCSLELFGEDFGDLADLTTADQVARGFYPVVICEGCGPTQVDHKGVCQAEDCDKRHGADDDAMLMGAGT